MDWKIILEHILEKQGLAMCIGQKLVRMEMKNSFGLHKSMKFLIT
jgi:hypothetical protein